MEEKNEKKVKKEKKEKNEIKISLSTFFLIIALVILVIMGFLLYEIYRDKESEVIKTAELENQVSSLNILVNDLQNELNEVSETSNTNSATIEENNENTTTSTTNNNISNSNGANVTSFTEEQVKEATSEYLDLLSYASCGIPLEKLNINYDSSKDSINTNSGVITTTVKFSDYKNAMLNYVTESEFERNWTSKIGIGKDNNGYVTHGQLGGGKRTYTIKDISKVNDTSYIVKASSVVDGNQLYQENNYTFVYKLVNGKCVVDSCE